MPKNLKFQKLSKKVIVSFLFFILITGAFLFFNKFAQAQTDQFGMNYAAKIGLSDKDPRLVILELVRIALGFVGIIAVFLVMYAGYLWMTSAGNDDKISQAKKILVNAVIGLVIMLAAFLIVSFIINAWNNTLQDSSGGKGRGNQGGGIGAMGNCAIESVYPEPYQREVPRNTSLVVTFRDILDPTTVMGSDGMINTNGVKIFKTNDRTNIVTNVRVATNDNRTFVFSPVEYLGSPSEYIWYSVNLGGNIQNSAHQSIFAKCGINKDYEWTFEVSNKVDLIPPQVLSGGVFPRPDNQSDTVTGAAAVSARGSITVNNQPAAHVDAHVNNVVPGGGSPAATAIADANCSQSGTYVVTIEANNIARLSRGTTDLGSATYNGTTVTFENYFTLTSSADYVQGNSWNVNLTAEIQADKISVNSTTYTFVSGQPQGNQISVNADNNTTASNIFAALSSNADIIVTLNNNIVNIMARIAGAAGNNIIVKSSGSAALSIAVMAGGVDSKQTVTVNGGSKDEPRNAVVQVNFNEAINPLTISGMASSVSDYIRIVNNEGNGANGSACDSASDCASYNCSGGECRGDVLSGKFMVSNIYRTVEFVSDNLCGVNGCGEKIYCLPENSNLRVEIIAAPLANCDNCPAKAPFSSCSAANHCYNSANGQNLPTAAFPPEGVVDLALNSLDGDRNAAADGPGSFFNQNTLTGGGDDFEWSFFISDKIDLTPPTITSTVPNHTAQGTNLSDPLKINFSKLMMSYTLTTGSREIDNGVALIQHKLINIWNFANKSVGYWTAKNDIDTTTPPDGNMDYTQAEIRHSLFADTTSYRSQVGSGVKDIYQNCFSPSAGPGGSNPACNADQNLRSCCPQGGAINPSSNVNPGGNCPQN